MQQNINMGKSTLNMQAKEKMQPFAKYHAGAIRGTVWKNDGVGKDNKPYTFYTSTIIRIYKDGEEWKETGSFRKDDLPKVRLISEQIYSLLVLGNESE